MNFTTIIKVGILSGTILMSNMTFAHPGVGFTNPLDPEGSPTFQVDYGRSITGIITGVINLCSDGEQKAQLIVTQEETNKKADGTADNSTNSATQSANSSSSKVSVADTALTSGAYDYIKKQVLDKSNPYQYDVLKQELGAAPSKEKTKEAVLKVFFAQSDKDETYKNKIYNQRQKYAETITNYHITLGNDVQKNVIKDLQAAGSAPVSSDNEVGTLAIDAQTLDEMIKMTLVDLTLQVELMEADAMDFMLRQPVVLLDNPSKEVKE